MNLIDLKKISFYGEGEIFFDYDLKKSNWFNIGGKTKVFFKPHTLKCLINFLKLYSNRGKIFILGAGSNVLISDQIFDGVVIKLGKNFSNLSVLNENLIIAGCAVSQKKLSEFAKENNLSGVEFMYCIPGSVGGGIRMNSGCFNKEFKDNLLSIQYIDYNGNVKSINSNNINFEYRGSNLANDLIFLSATFKTEKKDKEDINKLMVKLKTKKENAQPTKIKTGGSTFKNPIDQTDKKVWELIKESVPSDLSFGDAKISKKHMNFFVNEKNAKFHDMKKLIDTVKRKVIDKTGIDIKLEVVIVE